MREKSYLLDVERRARKLVVYQRNITKWGPAAVAKLKDANKSVDVFAFQETHLGLDDSQRLLMDWHSAGWKGVVSPALPSRRRKTPGGVTVGVRSHLSSLSYRDLAARPEQAEGLGRVVGQAFSPGPIDFWDLAPIAIRANGITITIVSIYLESSEGLGSVNNQRKLATLKAFTTVVQGPWIAIGDWNSEPHQVAPWARKLQAELLVPRSDQAHYTCTAGAGRLLDFALLSLDARAMVDSYCIDPTGVWRSHYGTSLTLNLEADPLMLRVLRMPRRFVHPPLEKQKPHPDSKRQRKLAEHAAQQRRANCELPCQSRVEPKMRVTAKSPPPLAFLRVREFGFDDAEGGQLQEEEPALLSDDPFVDGPPEDPSLDMLPESDSWERLPQPSPSAVLVGGEASDDILDTDDAVHGRLPREALRPQGMEVHASGQFDADAVWGVCMAEASAKPFRGRPPEFVRDSPAYQVAPQAADELAARYARWVGAFERFFLTKYNISPRAAGQFSGRARALEFTHVRAPTGHFFRSTPDPAANWWCTAGGWLCELAKHLHAREGRRAASLFDRLKDWAALLPVTGSLPLAPSLREQWSRGLRNIRLLDDGTIRRMASAAQSNAVSARRAVAAKAVQTYSCWVEQAAGRSIAKLFRRLRDPEKVPNETLGCSARLDFDTSAALEDKADTWRAKWTTASCFSEEVDGTQASGSAVNCWVRGEASRPLSRVLQALAAAREAAARGNTPPLQWREFEEVVRSAPANKGCGVERYGVGGLRRLPRAGLQQYFEMLRQVESSLALPWQWYVVLVSLIPKPSGVGDRAIGLLVDSLRLLTAMRRGVLSSWRDQVAGAWDTAISGSSSLRAALLRSFRDEMVSESKLRNFVSCDALWDVEAFYDSLDVPLLVQRALALGFPAKVLALELLGSVAPRVLRDKGSYSLPVQPERSIVAGSRAGPDMSRAYLFEVLDEVFRQHPAVSLKSWLDDMVQRAEGTRRHVVAALTHGAVHLVRRLRASGLNVATKSVILASEASIAAEVVRSLSDHGICVSSARVAQDLGVDRGAIGGFGRPKQSKRWQEAARGFNRARKIPGSLRRGRATATRLALAGPLAKAEYADGIYGVAPTAVTRRRRQLAGVIAPGFSRRCLTTLLQTEVPQRDPFMASAFSVLDEWTFLLGRVELHPYIKRTWPLTRDALQQRSPRLRWKRVRGTMGAMICLLLDIGWEPVGPADWLSETKRFFAPLGDLHASLDPVDWRPLRMAFAEALQRRLWQRASSYFAGQGLEEAPPDLFVLRRQMRTAKRRGNFRWLGALRAVTCGASWTRGRLRDEGMHVDSALCPRCGQEVETLRHRCYGCPRNQDIPCCSRMASQLVRRANVELDNGRNPSLWLRGLTPSSWTEVPPPPEQVEVEWAIKDVDATCSFEGTIFAGGDGSGGRHGKDSRLRRAGWGAVILRAQRGIAPSALAEATFAAIGSAPVAGPHQSVNLAELLAFRHVLECTQHLSSLRLLYVLDSKYVSRGMAKLWRGRWPRTCVHEWKKRFAISSKAEKLFWSASPAMRPPSRHLSWALRP